MLRFTLFLRAEPFAFTLCGSGKVRDRIDSDWFVDEEDSELSEKQADSRRCSAHMGFMHPNDILELCLSL